MLQLLPMPPPPPEYCFLWLDRLLPPSYQWWACMQKSEWSGWAQFIGAVLAIVVAICVPMLKDRRTRKNDFHWAQASLMGLGQALEDCRDACAVHDHTDFHIQRLQLQRAIEDCSALQFSSLTHEEWGGLVGCRNLADDLYQRTFGLAQNADWEAFRKRFDSIAQAIGGVGRRVFGLK